MQKSVRARYFVTRLKLRKSLISKRAGRRIRTGDLLITNQLLYRLIPSESSPDCHTLKIASVGTKPRTEK
jgi:hypothetical protein